MNTTGKSCRKKQCDDYAEKARNSLTLSAMMSLPEDIDFSGHQYASAAKDLDAMMNMPVDEGKLARTEADTLDTSIVKVYMLTLPPTYLSHNPTS